MSLTAAPSPASPLLALTRRDFCTNVAMAASPHNTRVVFFFLSKQVFTVLPLNPSVVLSSILSSSGSGASQTLLMLHRFYGVPERLNFAPLSAGRSNYRFCRDTQASKQTLLLIICDRKRVKKGTLMKLIWILSSSSEVNSCLFDVTAACLWNKSDGLNRSSPWKGQEEKLDV